MKDDGGGPVLQQGLGGAAVGHLAAGEEKGDSAAEAVGQGMDFGRASAARAADRLGALPSFAPAAQ